jgi:outer membrane beta-barrel protein
MKNVIKTIAFIAAMMMALPAQGQSNKYQRPGKKKAAEVAPAAGTALNEAKPAAEVKSDKKSEKVDIQQIENDYWQQKDTEFHVVQSRKYSKEKKFFLSAGYGTLVNDSFNTGGMFLLSGGYYFKETYGVELFYMGFNARNSKTVNEIFTLTGAPSYSHPLSEMGATFNWMPIYGKVSVFDKSIIYYDLGINVGAGIHKYERVVQTGNETDSTPMFIADITQQFFLSDRFALRFDIKNRYYSIDLKKYRSPFDTKSDTNFTTDAVLGLVFYFDKNDFKKKQK